MPGRRAEFAYEWQVAHLCAVHSVNNLLYMEQVVEADFEAVWRLMPFLEATGELHRCLPPRCEKLTVWLLCSRQMPPRSRGISGST